MNKYMIFGIVLILLSSFVVASNSSDLSQMSLFYYKLEEAALPYVDAVGTLDLTTSTNIPAQDTGIIDFGQNFDLANTEDASSIASELVELQAPVISTWINMTSFPAGAGGIVGANTFSGNTYGWVLQQRTPAQAFLRFSVYDAAGNFDEWTTEVQNVNEWVHVFAWFDPSLDGGDIGGICINGVLNGSLTTDNMNVIGYEAGTSTKLTLGAFRPAVVHGDSIIDEVYLGNMSGVSITDCSYAQFLYNAGAPDVKQQYPFPEDLPEFIAIDFDSSTAINTFNASFVNSSNTTNIETINGTIVYYNNQIANITFTAEHYVPRTYTNYNTNASLESKLINRTNKIGFFDAVTSIALDNATVDITYPSTTIVSKATDVNGFLDFDTILSGSIEYGEYIITLTSQQGYITPIVFTRTINESEGQLVENFNVSTANISISIYDRETNTLLNKLTEIIMISVFNSSTSNGTLSYQNISLTAQTYTIQAISSGYKTESQSFDYTNRASIDVNFYMLNLTGNNTGTLFVNVIDEFYRVIEGATVSLYEYDTVSRSYIKISDSLTNSNGEASFTIELNIKTYRLKAEKVIEGQTFTAQTNAAGEIITTDNEIRNLFLLISTEFVSQPTDYLTITISETFASNISTIFIDFSTTDNFLTEICVEYYDVENTIETSLYQQCVISSSAYSATPVLINRSRHVIARVYQVEGTAKIILKTYDYPAINSFSQLLEINNYTKYILLFLWIILIVLMFKTENLMILVFLGILLAWAELAWFPNLKTAIGSIFKTVILILMFFTGKKKEDT